MNRLAAALSIGLTATAPFAASANDKQFAQADSVEALVEYAEPVGQVGFIYYSSAPDAEEQASEIATRLYGLISDHDTPVHYIISPAGDDITSGSVRGINSQGFGDVLMPEQVENNIWLGSIILDDEPPDADTLAEIQAHLKAIRERNAVMRADMP